MHKGSFSSLVLLIVGSLSACSAVTPAGLIAASRLDPLGTPADQISVGVGVPLSVRLNSGDAVLRIAFRGGTSSSTVLIEEEVPLKLTIDRAGLIRANSADEQVYIASLAPEDAARFSAAQAAIKNARAQGAEGNGSLTVQVIRGCYRGTQPAGLPVSTWLRTSDADAFVPLTRQIDAFDTFGRDGTSAVRRILAPC